MNRYRLILICLLALGIWPFALQAATPPEKPIFDRDWIAGSTTAMGVTGDMRMTPDSITFDGRVTYKLRFVAEIVPQQPESRSRDIPSYSLYQVANPQPRAIRQRTGLCGNINKPEAVYYLAIGYDAESQTLHVMAFGGKTQPADINYSVKGVCGGYGYFLETSSNK